MHTETYCSEVIYTCSQCTLCDTGISRGKSLFYSVGWTHSLHVKGWIARSLLIQDIHFVT